MMARERRLRGARRAVAVIALALCVSGSGILGYLAWQERQDRRTGEAFYATLARDAVETEARAAALTGADASGGEGAPQATNTRAGEAPALARDRVCEVDFEKLRQRYGDVVGWIRQEDGSINYPVVQGEDNVYYLDHLPDGTQNAAGSIMLDQVNAADFSNAVSILHGHHMREGAMFGELENYAQESYYRAHPRMKLLTPAGNYEVLIFAACTVDGSRFEYPTSFEDKAAFDAFVDAIRSATPYEAPVDVAYTDRLLLLSTCAYSYRDARFVVLGKLKALP